MSRKQVVVGIALFVGVLHFIVGPHYQGPMQVFVSSYLIDLMLPFSMFLVLGLAGHPLVRSLALRALLVFGTGAVAETLQYFDVPVFGRTFDPFDYLAFAFSVMVAVLFEVKVLVYFDKRDDAEI